MREITKTKPSNKEDEMSNEYIDFEKDRAEAREYAESVFSNDTSPQVEEGHELDYMRMYDSHESEE